jgi:hypothetical protein
MVLKERVGLGDGPPVEPPIVSGDAPVHTSVGGIIEATGARMNTGASILQGGPCPLRVSRNSDSGSFGQCRPLNVEENLGL